MTSSGPDKEASFKAVEVPSVLRGARTAAEAVLREVDAAHYTPEAEFAIKLALEEALTNAIRHGNGNDPRKRVVVRYAVTREKCIIAVQDEGGGFRPERVPDCTTTERLALPHGRGIMLMRAYMDVVEYRRGGRELYMVRFNR